MIIFEVIIRWKCCFPTEISSQVWNIDFHVEFLSMVFHFHRAKLVISLPVIEVVLHAIVISLILRSFVRIQVAINTCRVRVSISKLHVFVSIYTPRQAVARQNKGVCSSSISWIRRHSISYHHVSSAIIKHSPAVLVSPIIVHHHSSSIC